MVCSCPVISKLSSLCINPFLTEPRASITIGITVTFMELWEMRIYKHKSIMVFRLYLNDKTVLFKQFDLAEVICLHSI